MTDGWFPRLSPDGRHVASGAEVIFVDGVEIGPGVQPVWLAASAVLYRDREDTRLHVWHLSGARDVIDLPSGCNLIDAQAGRWVGWFAGYRPTRVRTSDGQEYVDAYGPTISPTGDVAYTDGAGNLWVYAAVLGRHARCPRWTTGGLVWLEEYTRHQPRLASVNGWANAINLAHSAVAVATPKGPVLVVLEDDRLIAYVASEEHGWIVAEGETFHPDAVWADGRLRVVWNSRRGEPGQRVLHLDEPTVPLRRVMPTPEPPPVTPEPPMPQPMPPFDWAFCSVAPHSAQEIARWPLTSLVTTCAVELTGRTDDIVHVDHSKAGRWPVVDTGEIAGLVEGTMWAGLPQSDGSWRLGTFDWLRSGQTEKGMTASDYGKGYALAFDDDYVVRAGDPIAYFVSTPARGDVRTKNERSGLTIIRYGTGDVLWRENAASLPPDPPDPPPVDPPVPPVEPPSSDLAALEARVAALELYAVRQKAWAWAYPDLKGR